MLMLVWVMLLQVLIQAAWTLASIIDSSPASMEAMISAQGLEAILKQLSQLSSGHSGTSPASPQASAAVDAMLTVLVLMLTQHSGASVRFCNEVKARTQPSFAHLELAAQLHD